MKQQLTAERLRELYSYDPSTGVFTRRCSWNRHKAGPVQTKGDGRGYLRLYIDGQRYRQHRLAYLYVHGEWPPSLLDHKNGETANNVISNLRPADVQLNAENRTACNKNNKLRILGVSPKTRKDGSLIYRSQICAKGKVIALGEFKSAEEARATYLAAKMALHPGFSGLLRASPSGAM